MWGLYARVTPNDLFDSGHCRAGIRIAGAGRRFVASLREWRPDRRAGDHPALQQVRRTLPDRRHVQVLVHDAARHQELLRRAGRDLDVPRGAVSERARPEAAAEAAGPDAEHVQAETTPVPGVQSLRGHLRISFDLG